MYELVALGPNIYLIHVSLDFYDNVNTKNTGLKYWEVHYGLEDLA